MHGGTSVLFVVVFRVARTPADTACVALGKSQVDRTVVVAVLIGELHA